MNVHCPILNLELLFVKLIQAIPYCNDGDNLAKSRYDVDDVDDEENDDVDDDDNVKLERSKSL